jgi:hypothetical protein
MIHYINTVTPTETLTKPHTSNCVKHNTKKQIIVKPQFYIPAYSISMIVYGPGQIPIRKRLQILGNFCVVTTKM